jgi:hypothetical protein
MILLRVEVLELLKALAIKVRSGYLDPMDNYIVARDRFKPSGRIRFLLIAESPPASGGYFYFDWTTGRSSLFSETMKALGWFPEDEPMPKGFDKVSLLRKFQSLEFFMIDVSYRPLDKGLSRKEREDCLKNEIPRRVDEIRKLDPESIIIVKVTLFNMVK